MQEIETIGRARNTRLITLTEGDVMIRGGELFEVQDGEVDVFADGTISEGRGSLHEVSKEALSDAIARGSEIFDYDEVV